MLHIRCGAWGTGWDGSGFVVDGDGEPASFPADAPAWLRARLEPGRTNERSAALDAAGRTAFAAFVRAFLERYQERNPGVIEWVQFGNEWGEPRSVRGDRR